MTQFWRFLHKNSDPSLILDVWRDRDEKISMHVIWIEKWRTNCKDALDDGIYLLVDPKVWQKKYPNAALNRRSRRMRKGEPPPVKPNLPYLDHWNWTPLCSSARCSLSARKRGYFQCISPAYRGGIIYLLVKGWRWKDNIRRYPWPLGFGATNPVCKLQSNLGRLLPGGEESFHIVGRPRGFIK